MSESHMNLDPKLLSVRLECIAETIRTRPVLGHWPAMQAHIDAQAVLQARDEIERLRDLLRRAAEVVDGCCRCLDYSPVGKEVEAELRPSVSIAGDHHGD